MAGYFISLTPQEDEYEVRTHGLYENKVSRYLTYADAHVAAVKLGKEIGLWVHDYSESDAPAVY